MTPAVNIIIRGGLLAETKAYIAASGATDKRSIDLFIRAMKSAGIWTSLVEGWTLPSTQNAGTGSTAYGLKGVSNGTLTNGPTWGTSGIAFASDPTTGRTKYITCPWTGLYDIRANSTVIVVTDAGEVTSGSSVEQIMMTSNASGTYQGIDITDSAGAGSAVTYGPSSAGIKDYAFVGGQALPAGTFRMWTTQRENNDPLNSNTEGNKQWKDAVEIAHGSNLAAAPNAAIPNPSTSITIGNYFGPTLAVIGNISFVGIWSDWTIAPSTLRSLLQSTILQGVLP